MSREIFTSKFGQYLAERGPFDPHPFARTHFGDGPFFDGDYFNWKNRQWVTDGISFGGYFSPNFQWGSAGENYGVGEFLFFGIWEPIRHNDRAGRLVIGFAHDQTIGSLTTRKFANSENIVETTDDLDTDPDKTFTTLGLLAWEYEHLTATDAGFAYRAGQLFLPTYFAGAVYLDDDRRFFLARPLAAAGGAQWAGANDIGLGAHVQVWNNGFYASLAIADGDADRKAPNISSLANGRLIYVTEFGFEQDLDGPDAFSVRLTFSHLDETQRDGVKPPGEAVIVSVSRKFADRWAVAGRWSKSYRRLTSEYQELYSLAVLRLRPLGFDDDFAGFGVFIGAPSDASKGTEYGAELNYKVRLTQALSVMPDVQYWHRNDPDGTHIRSWVVGFRLNIEF